MLHPVLFERSKRKTCSSNAVQEHARIRDAGGGPCPRAGGQLEGDTRQNVGSWQMRGEAAQGRKAH